MEEVFHNIDHENDSHGVTVGHYQMCHRVQRCTPDQHLRRLPGKPPRADPLAEDRLHPKHLRLGQTPPVIAHFLLPLFAPDLPDAPQILIADQPLFLAIAVLPYLRISARRDGRLRLALADGLVAIALVIRTIATDLLDLFRNLLQQLFQHLRTFRKQLADDHTTRTAQLTQQLGDLKAKQTAEESAYKAERTQLQLTRDALTTLNKPSRDRACDHGLADVGIRAGHKQSRYFQR